MLEWMFSCCSIVHSYYYIHTMYFFYYTTRPALCKELHSVLAFLLTIKYQMIVQCFRIYICLTYTQRVLRRNALCVLPDWGNEPWLLRSQKTNTALAPWRFLRLTSFKEWPLAELSSMPHHLCFYAGLFLRRPVFTLILFGVVVCILVCMYLGNKSYVASIIFITSRRSESRPKTPIFTRAM